MLFEPGSNDRLSLLLAAADTFGSVMAQVATTTRSGRGSSSTWRSVSGCWVDMPRRPSWRASWTSRGVEPQERFLRAAELIRGAIGQSDFAAAQRLLEQGREIGGQASAELDFAWFEALVGFCAGRPAGDSGRLLKIAVRRASWRRNIEQQAADAARQMEETLWAVLGAAGQPIARLPRSPRLAGQRRAAHPGR